MNKSYVSNRDLAPTALNALGLQKGKYMTGRILEEAYQKDACPGDKAGKAKSQTVIFVTIHCLVQAWLLI